MSECSICRGHGVMCDACGGQLSPTLLAMPRMP